MELNNLQNNRYILFLMIIFSATIFVNKGAVQTLEKNKISVATESANIKNIDYTLMNINNIYIWKNDDG